jgi:hypothetical protein
MRGNCTITVTEPCVGSVPRLAQYKGGSRLWVVGSGANTVKAASKITGLNIRMVLKADEDDECRETDEIKKPEQVSEATKDDEGTETDWIIILRAHEATKKKQQYIEIIRVGIRQRAKGIIMVWASETSTTAEVKDWRTNRTMELAAVGNTKQADCATNDWEEHWNM